MNTPVKPRHIDIPHFLAAHPHAVASLYICHNGAIFNKLLYIYRFDQYACVRSVYIKHLYFGGCIVVDVVDEEHIIIINIIIIINNNNNNNNNNIIIIIIH